MATEQDDTAELRRGLRETVIGAIGSPIGRAIRDHGLKTDITPESVNFEQLADLTVEKIGEE